jgi:hypothetical protein
MRFTARSASIAKESNGIDVQCQGDSAAVGRGLRIENVRLSEGLLEGMNAERALV